MLTTGTDGGVYLADATVAEKVVLSAEYAGAVLDADGSDNVVSITSDSSPSPTFMNYYEVSNSATDGGTNDYDIILRFTLPSDFDSWVATAITINFEGTADASFEADVYEPGTLLQNNTAVSGTGIGTFSSSNIATSTQIAALTAGDTGVIVIKVTVTDVTNPGDSLMRLGDITLNYNRKTRN